MTSLYSARWVLPIVSQMIGDGAVAIDDSSIVAVGPRTEIVSRFPDSRMTDFGEAAILPGLINAHSHLELTVMRGFLEREENDFFAWLRKLTLARLAMTGDDLVVSATCGAIEAARAGVTFLGDANAAAAQGIKALQALGLRGIVYQESFGPDPRLAMENVAELHEQISQLRALEDPLVRVGVSPHSPYTVSGPQLELISRLALDQQIPLMMHAAESPAEKLFMSEGLGPFAEGLSKRGIDWQAPGISTIQYLKRHGVLETRPLLAHCLNVDDEDLQIIKQSNSGIAHCPKSNAKLGHGRAPFANFLKHGVRVGFGSDSVASNNTCDILEEARFATLLARLEIDPESTGVNATEALFAATAGGARALGLENQIGSLAPGMEADIAVISLAGAHQRPVRDPFAALVFASSGRDVLMTMVAGKEIYRDGLVSGVDEGEIRERLTQVRSKIEAASS
ncbi:MAG TPA: amidohydrolase family protein [Pyrinomonadaceae bacterium]|nr:amidohydrolase family protein [Pyrinomonadaceae bacterium]